MSFKQRKAARKNAFETLEELSQQYPGLMSPEKILLLIANGIKPKGCRDKIDIHTRIKAADKAAPYYAPKIAQETLVEIQHNFLDMDEEEKKKTVQQLLQDDNIKHLMDRYVSLKVEDVKPKS